MRNDHARNQAKALRAVVYARDSSDMQRWVSLPG